ncbi:hypothetical protein RND71_016226 [Anisodus tanguticus]|uniref:40S ribosomal protein S6 n=1 Tax=Anisodus tanguticus TaxID=243964 RepID=A0AAE1VCH8_9SOLA|nr:hypothetical protein RND71_016226 [Anisodus tanguticus]
MRKSRTIGSSSVHEGYPVLLHQKVLHMELLHAAIPDLDASTSFFGVYDGHGGMYVVVTWFIIGILYIDLWEKSFMFIQVCFPQVPKRKEDQLSRSDNHTESEKENLGFQLLKDSNLVKALTDLKRAFFDKRISQEVSGDALGEEFKGYVFKIMGGCDKQGTPCFRGYGRRNGERRRKSVRGCIVSPDLSVLNLVIVKKGENDLPGLTDTEKPRMRGPKRASKIRKLFNLSKEDDVRKYVNTYRRNFTTKAGKNASKAPKIQRLVTPLTLQIKRARIADKKKRIAKAKSEAADYQKLPASRLKEQRERRSESLAKKRSRLSAALKPSIAA